MKSEYVQGNILWSPVKSLSAGRGTGVSCSLASMTVSLWFFAPHVFLMRLAHFSEAPIINVPVRIEDTCKIEVSVVLHLT